VHWKKLIVVIVGIFILSSLQFLQTASAQTLSLGNFQPVTNTGVSSVIVEKPIIIDDNIFLIGVVLNNPTDAFFVKSIDGGQNFQAPIILDTSSIVVRSPKLSVSGNFVYTVWEQPGTTTTQAFFARSVDGGDSFLTPIDLSNTPFPRLVKPNVASSQNFVFAVWNGETTGLVKNLFFTKSDDNGANFSAPEILRTNIDVLKSIEIIATGNTVHLLWQESNEIFYMNSNDNGENFNTPINLSSTVALSSQQILLVSNNKVYAVWAEGSGGTNINVFFSVSIDNGQNFSTPLDITMNTNASVATDLAVFGNNVYILYFDRIPVQSALLAVSNDNGQTFPNLKILSNEIDTIFSPTLSANGNNIFVTWLQETVVSEPLEVFFTFSTDNGLTFSQPENLSNTAGTATATFVVANNDDVHVFWNEESGGILNVVHSFGVVQCFPPFFGNWVVDSSCTMPSSSLNTNIRFGDLIVQNNSVLAISSGVALTVPSGHKIIVESGSGILIKSGGTLRITV